MDIVRLDPDDATAVTAWADLVNRCRRVDAPWRFDLTPAVAAAEFRRGWDGEPVTPYLLLDEESPVAAGWIATSDRDNRHLAWLDVRVDPGHRRRGHGSALLGHLEDIARRLGRTTTETGAEESDALAGFAAAHGYRGPLYVEVIRRQRLAGLDRSRLDAAYAEAAGLAHDYALERTRMPSPESTLAELAVVTAAINDAPTGDLAVEDEVYTAERIAGYEAAQLAHGLRMYRVVARHRPTGTLAGHTVMAVDSEQPIWAEQHDTAVLPAHRGHRLGLLMKVEMLRWMAEVEPQLDVIDTGNADTNAHMVGVNERLGYRVAARLPFFQRDLGTAGSPHVVRRRAG